ncbi:hypothetical protein PJN38_17110 [Mycobacterium kansasii]
MVVDVLIADLPAPISGELAAVLQLTCHSQPGALHIGGDPGVDRRRPHPDALTGSSRFRHEGSLATFELTSAGVSAGLDLALWLAGEIGGEGRAKAIQLAIEYDPQPPFDSGHMSKASVTTKAAATALLSKDSVKPANLTATTMLAWQQTLTAVRSRRRRRQPESNISTKLSLRKPRPHESP